MQDVKVQRLANIKLSEISKEVLGMNSNNFISISSFAVNYMKSTGAFDGVYQQHGMIRKYIQQFVCGGRCMTSNNKMYKTHLKLCDFNAVSLYPSAMRRCYFPTGIPHKLSQEQIEYYNNCDNLFKITEDKDSKDQNTLFLTVKLFKPRGFINRAFPVIDNGCMKSDDIDGRQFTNNQEGLHFLTHIRLQDAIKFQGYSYKIIDGIYYTERNYQIQDEIQKIFDERARCKVQQKQYEKNGDNVNASKFKALQQMYKLIMNSIYGKTIEKLHPIKHQIFNNVIIKDGEEHEVFSSEILSFIKKNFFDIKEMQQFGEDNIICQTTKQVLDNECNFNQCGVVILDMSKRIMNEVMCLAEDLKIKMFYQDTDSIHMEESRVEDLQQAYYQKYNRQLIGKNLGQFHSDFESKTGKEVLYSDYSIFVGKKCYLDRMVLENGDKEFKFTMKGVPQQCIENHELGIQEVYEKLFNRESIKFDLLKYKVCMEFSGSKNGKYTVKNRDSFEREIKFVKNEIGDENLMYQF